MKCDIINQMGVHYQAMTKMEKRVADYVRENVRDVMFLSISELAERCNVGDTTVFRFCRSLGVNGYQDFRMLLAQCASSESDIMPVSDDIRLDDDVELVCTKLLNMEQDALRATFQMLDYNQVERIVDLLEKAKRIGFFGMGSSGVTALAAKNRFLRVLPRVFGELDGHMQAMTSALMGPGELAMVFSYSGTTKDTLDMVERMKKNGVTIVCITRFTKSPMTEFADEVLLCGANEGPMQGGALSTKISQLFLMDILYTEYYRRNYSECTDNRRRAVEAISQKLL